MPPFEAAHPTMLISPFQDVSRVNSELCSHLDDVR